MIRGNWNNKLIYSNPKLKPTPKTDQQPDLQHDFNLVKYLVHRKSLNWKDNKKMVEL
jgi:hypothetical protein